jgi:GNAT superfamily N-acetyltransferase
MSAVITAERPDAPDAAALVEELEAYLTTLYPAAARHGYSVAKLISEGVSFFVLRCDGRAAGCGGIQLFGTEYGELKRMYVRPEFRGQGLGKQLLDHLTDFARRRDVGLLRLETGVHQHAAIRLYEHEGFHATGRFGTYGDAPLSRFYEKRIL